VPRALLRYRSARRGEERKTTEAPEQFFSGGGARNLILVAYLSRALEGRKFNRKLAGY